MTARGVNSRITVVAAMKGSRDLGNLEEDIANQRIVAGVVVPGEQTPGSTTPATALLLRKIFTAPSVFHGSSSIFGIRRRATAGASARFPRRAARARGAVLLAGS